MTPEIEKTPYSGFEQGPIRPPSEAHSLLIRVTRNCPWNHCTFCPVYKGSKFSLRPVEHVIQDIDTVHRYVSLLREEMGDHKQLTRTIVDRISPHPNEMQAFHAAVNWCAGGMQSIFLQDANSLLIKPKHLIAILAHLKSCFPFVERITSYARSHTIARISDPDLKEIAATGLNRIHIGLESGSDAVLEKVRKGASKALHVKAGIKVKTAGMELSEYIMPGLGGKALSENHALETADALNQINPDFIRLRTLAIPNQIPLYEEWQTGQFEKCTDLMMAQEIQLLLMHLTGIESWVKSDHILNLFDEVQGKLPEEKQKMIAVTQKFMDMPPQTQMLFQVGRRLGMFTKLTDMQDDIRVDQVTKTCRQMGITPNNVDQMIDEIMKRFI